MKFKVNILGVDEIYNSLIWKEEIVKVLKKCKNGKFCGVDGIIVDILKVDIKIYFLEIFFNYLKLENILVVLNKGFIVIILFFFLKKKWYLYLWW